MAVAVETSFGPNQTAASRAGMPSMKTCATAQIVCAVISSGNNEVRTAAHFSHAPSALRNVAVIATVLRPRRSSSHVTGTMSGMYANM